MCETDEQIEIRSGMGLGRQKQKIVLDRVVDRKRANWVIGRDPIRDLCD